MADVLAFLESLPRGTPLAEALAAAIDVAERALHVFSRAPGELAFSFNGGKDSTAVLHVLRAALARRASRRAAAAAVDDDDDAPAPRDGWLGGVVPVVYFAPGGGTEFAAVHAFMAEAGRAHGFTLRRLPPFQAGLAALLSEGVRGVLMGTRRTDPDGAGLEHFSPATLDWPPLLRVCPVLGWGYGCVWAFLRGAGLPYVPLYDEGFSSLGCVEDSAPNPMLLVAEAEGDAAGDGQRGGHRDAAAAATPGAPQRYRPAWQLAVEDAERLGRTKRAKAAGGGDVAAAAAAAAR